MITRSKKLIFYSVAAIFLLMVISGCAQTRPAVKGDGPVSAGKGGAAVIQGIKVASDASQVEIQTNKPLSYTYYKTTEPPRIVIDISQTDPGPTAGSQEVNAGNIKRIEVTKHEFTGGFLSRIEIIPIKELGDFSVATDSTDKGKLLVIFAQAPTAESQVAGAKGEAKPATEDKAADSQIPPGKDEGKSPAAEPSAPVAQQPVQPENGAAAATKQEEKQAAGDNVKDTKAVSEIKPEKVLRPQVLTAVAAAEDGVEIAVGGGVAEYNAFKLNKPDRIVLDLPRIKNGIAAKSVAINNFGIAQARLGSYAGKVRIVLDAVKGSLPPYHIVKTADGLKVVLAEVPASGAEKGEKEPAKETAMVAPVEAKKEQPDPAPSAENQKVEKANDTGKNAKPVADSSTASIQEAKILNSVAPADDGIEVGITGGIDTFSVFKMTKPDRIVLDLPGVKNRVAARQVAINKFGVAQARLGSYPDKVRIVLDSAKDVLPSYQVVKDANGLKVVFADASAKPAEKADKEPVKESAVTTDQAKVVKHGGSAVGAIDFRIVGQYSQIALRLGGDCRAGKVTQVANGLSLAIHDCQVPNRLQRTIDTSAFPGVVQKIIPYQVRVKKGSEARILVKLRQKVADSSLKPEGDTILWDIRNPEVASLPAVAAKQAVVEAPSVEAPSVPVSGNKEKVIQGAESSAVQDAAYRPGEKKIYTGRRVSLEFSDADIRKILQLIAEVSNLNFIIGDDVTGTISIKLVNVPWDQALDVILDTKGLEKRQVGNIMYIKPKGKFKTEEQEEAEAKKEHERRMELKTQVFEINFASVSDIASQFDKLKSDRGTISKDDRTNRVIVTDIEERIEKMRKLLKELDLPEKQVMIEARIVEATSTFSRDLGVQWGLHYKDGSASFMGINNLDLGLGGIVTNAPTSGTFSDTSTTTSGGASSISFGKLTSNVQLDLKLSASATIGQIKVISTPKVITLNNKAAKISQGQSIPYQTVSAEGTQTQFVEAALTLEVTPHVANDGSISMKIKASNNSAGTGTPPPINKKEATTEVQVMTGETIVIGGIYQDSDTENNAGVPFLQDIPLLGWLFKSNSKSKTKTELLIFITPKIVS